MKKFIVIMTALLMFSFASQAQTLTWSGYGNTLDTVTNAGSRSATAVTVSAPAKAFSMQVAVTKISGTVGGTVKWQGSNNGTDWYTISTDTMTDASAVYAYSIATAAPFNYYRALVTGTGTMSASVKGKAFVRQ